MTRIEQIRGQIEDGGEGCVQYGTLTDILDILEDMAGALGLILETSDKKEYVLQSFLNYKKWDRWEK